MRLSIYFDDEILSSDNDIEVFNNCFNLVEERLKEIDSECQISDIAILSFISKNWMDISNPEAFTEFFEENFLNFSRGNFAENLCEYYHRVGIDHILVGMRQTNYVDQLKKNF